MMSEAPRGQVLHPFDKPVQPGARIPLTEHVTILVLEAELAAAVDADTSRTNIAYMLEISL